MILNYVLLLITGGYSVATIVFLAQGKGWIGGKPIRSIATMVVFVLVGIATIMGLDYNTFQMMISTGLWSRP